MSKDHVHKQCNRNTSSGTHKIRGLTAPCLDTQSANEEVKKIKFQQGKAFYKSKFKKEHLMVNTALHRTQKTRSTDIPHLL